jgi:hypothetical protein
MAEPSSKSLDAYKADLEREAQSLGIRPQNYLAATDKPVAYRASMLPIGNYEDGSIAFPVWPQSAVDAGNALMRFHRGEAPRPEDAVLAGLAMTGGGIGGLAARPRLSARGSNAVSGKAPAHVEASRPLTSSPVETGSVDYTPSRAVGPAPQLAQILMSLPVEMQRAAFPRPR